MNITFDKNKRFLYAKQIIFDKMDFFIILAVLIKLFLKKKIKFLSLFNIILIYLI